MIRFKTILCPVDFFPGSFRAFDYALKLAGHYGARVVALHVVQPVTPAAYGVPLSAGGVMEQLERESKKMAEKLKAKGKAAGIPVDAEVSIGDIDWEIYRMADRRKAGLVVMGSHGRRGFERWMLGSVAEKAVRQCPVPLLLVGAAGTGVMRRSVPPRIARVLVTTDFSAGTQDALEYAFSIAQECQSRVRLLHIAPDTVAGAASATTNPLIQSIRANLEALVPTDARNWCRVDTRVQVGVPHLEIAALVESWKPGLLVMNIHGKGMFERALLGSTAERVLRSVLDACPVLLIPPMGKSGGRSKVSTNAIRASGAGR